MNSQKISPSQTTGFLLEQLETVVDPHLLQVGTGFSVATPL